MSYENMKHYRHIELKKLFERMNKCRVIGTPLECDAVNMLYRSFKDTTAYKRSIRGRINAKNASTIAEFRRAVIQATREMTNYYRKQG